MNAMICELCGKHNATVYFKGMINDQAIKMHVCEACAKKKGLMFPFGKSAQSLGQMISNLAATANLGGALLGLTCKTCGLNYAEFRQTSEFGCSQCYATFAQLIAPLLKKIQGSTQHIGKTYKRAVRTTSVVQELARLKLELRDAIGKEAYEEAARLRDQIQQLERSVGQPAQPREPGSGKPGASA